MYNKEQGKIFELGKFGLSWPSTSTSLVAQEASLVPWNMPLRHKH